MTTLREAVAQALDALTKIHPGNMSWETGDAWLNAVQILREALAQPEPEPVAWMYTLEYGSTTVETKVSLHQLRYPFGVCGADYLRANDDGVSYIRETPLYPGTKVQDTPEESIQGWQSIIPGGRATDKWESARVADYNQGWNDYRKAVKAALSNMKEQIGGEE